MNIEEIINKTNGIITAEDFRKFNITKYEIKKFLDDEKIYRYCRGIYIADGYFPDEFYIFQKKYKNSVFSYNTAMYLLELSERTPFYFDITLYSGYGLTKFEEKVKIHYTKVENLNLGKIKVKTPMGFEVDCYNKERILCDIIKGNNIGIDKEQANKFIKETIGKNKIDTIKLIDYAKKLKCEEKVRNVMEVFIW